MKNQFLFLAGRVTSWKGRRRNSSVFITSWKFCKANLWDLLCSSLQAWVSAIYILYLYFKEDWRVPMWLQASSRKMTAQVGSHSASTFASCANKLCQIIFYTNRRIIIDNTNAHSIRNTHTNSMVFAFPISPGHIILSLPLKYHYMIPYNYHYTYQ